MGVTSYTNLHTATVKDRIANATPEQIGAAATTVFAAEFNNQANTEDSVIKIWSSLASPTVSSASDFTFTIPAGKTITVMFGEGGHIFGSAAPLHMWIAAVTQADGSDSPEENVIFSLYTDALT